MFRLAVPRGRLQHHNGRRASWDGELFLSDGTRDAEGRRFVGVEQRNDGTALQQRLMGRTAVKDMDSGNRRVHLHTRVIVD